MASTVQNLNLLLKVNPCTILAILVLPSLLLGQWNYEIVASIGDCGRYNSLALSSLGYPHVVYTNYTNGMLMYCYKDISGWHHETVDVASGNCQGCAIVLDTLGYPHIAYHRANGADLYYAYKDVSGWHTAVVETQDNVGRWLSLAFDTNGYPHISYENYSNNTLRHAWRDSTGWHTETVDNTSNSWSDNNSCICIDELNCIHIAYRKNSTLYYAFKVSGGAWIKTQIDATPGDAEIDMKLDTLNYPHIVYGHGQYTSTRPWHAWRDINGWHTEQVVDINSHAHSIAIDSVGIYHVVFGRKYSDDNLIHTWKVGGIWYIENIYGPGQYRQPSLWHSTSFSKVTKRLIVSCYDKKDGDLMIFSKSDVGISDVNKKFSAYSFNVIGTLLGEKATFKIIIPSVSYFALRIYDASGRLIDKPIDGKYSAGCYEIPWTKKVSAGVYFYYLETPWQKKVGKFVLLR